MFSAITDRHDSIEYVTINIAIAPSNRCLVAPFVPAIQ